MTRHHFRWLATALLAVLATVTFTGAAAPDSKALLGGAGLEHGIIVQLGCADTEQTLDLSAGGKYVVHSVGPGGLVPANGPGTHTDLAEMVGVRGEWNLYLKLVDGESGGVHLTTGESVTNKEPEWLPVFPRKEVAE